VLPLVLWGCTVSSAEAIAVADLRYYWSILPLSVFVVYALACSTDAARKNRLTRILKTSSVLYLTGYIVISLVGIIFAFVPGERGAGQRAQIMGPVTALRHWPSMQVIYEFSPAREFVMGLLKEQPATLLLTAVEEWFYADPTVDPARVSGLDCAVLQGKHLSGPTRLVILSYDDGGPPGEVFSYVGTEILTRRQRADCLDQLPALTLLQRFPQERVKVLETQVPAGMRVILGGENHSCNISDEGYLAPL